MTPSQDRETLANELSSLLESNVSAPELDGWVSKHFPELEAYRENDDLILRNSARYLFVRRVAEDRFKTSENIAVPTTNVVDFGGGAARDVIGLVNEISAFAQT